MGIPLAAIPLAISAYSAIRGAGRGRGAGAEERRYGQRFGSSVDRLGRTSAGFEDRYMADLEGFDPEPAFTQATEARLDGFDRDFARGFSDKLGSMVGQGRTPSYSGFGLMDAQRTIEQGQEGRARIRQEGAGQVANARMGMLAQRGQYASGLGNRYMDAITGRLATLEGDRMTENASRRGMWGSVAGAGLSAAGTAYGARR